jgi:hypothetical protein
VASGDASGTSDIDLAVRGCPGERFFAIYGTLIRSLDHAVDLVDLDSDRDFAEFLETNGRLRHVA